MVSAAAKVRALQSLVSILCLPEVIGIGIGIGIVMRAYTAIGAAMPGRGL